MLKTFGAEGLGDQASRGREEECTRRTDHSRADDQVPEVGAAGQEQPGENDLHPSAHDVRDDHHQLAGETVGPYAADEDQEDAGQREGSQHQTDACRRAAQAQHREGHGHRDEGVANGTRGLADPQQPELSFLKWAQAPGQTFRRSHAAIVTHSGTASQGRPAQLFSE